jgi:hypothetical protein
MSGSPIPGISAGEVLHQLALAAPELFPPVGRKVGQGVHQGLVPWDVHHRGRVDSAPRAPGEPDAALEQRRLRRMEPVPVAADRCPARGACAPVAVGSRLPPRDLGPLALATMRSSSPHARHSLTRTPAPVWLRWGAPSPAVRAVMTPGKAVPGPAGRTRDAREVRVSLVSNTVLIVEDPLRDNVEFFPQKGTPSRRMPTPGRSTRTAGTAPATGVAPVADGHPATHEVSGIGSCPGCPVGLPGLCVSRRRDETAACRR